jgi:hypothetical protein
VVGMGGTLPGGCDISRPVATYPNEGAHPAHIAAAAARHRSGPRRRGRPHGGRSRREARLVTGDRPGRRGWCPDARPSWPPRCPDARSSWPPRCPDARSSWPPRCPDARSSWPPRCSDDAKVATQPQRGRATDHGTPRVVGVEDEPLGRGSPAPVALVPMTVEAVDRSPHHRHPEGRDVGGELVRDDGLARRAVVPSTAVSVTGSAGCDPALDISCTVGASLRCPDAR